MKRKLLLVVCLLLVVATNVYLLRANGSKRATKKNKELLFLKKSDKFVFYSLEPRGMDDWEGSDKNKEKFYENLVLGKIVVTDSTEKSALIDTLFKNMKPARTISYSCHSPRHGIRAIRGKHTMDLTICFSCQNIVFYLDRKIITDADESRNASQLFNQTLRKHHLPLANE